MMHASTRGWTGTMIRSPEVTDELARGMKSRAIHRAGFRGGGSFSRAEMPQYAVLAGDSL
jgi:hypothetical protein